MLRDCQRHGNAWVRWRLGILSSGPRPRTRRSGTPFPRPTRAKSLILRAVARGDTPEARRGEQPRAVPGTLPAMRDGEESRAGDGAGPVVLVVEDDPGMGEYLVPAWDP